MRYRQLAPSSSSNNNNTLEFKSCFNIKNEVEETDSNTNLTDINIDIKEDEADIL